MRFLNDKRNFFEAYESLDDLTSDAFSIIWDPICSLGNLVRHVTTFLVFSLPLAITAFTYGAPLLLLLAFPIALNLLTLNIPIILAITATVLFTAAAIHSMGAIIYDAADLILSPMMDALRVTTNLGATLIEQVAPAFGCAD